MVGLHNKIFVIIMTFMALSILRLSHGLFLCKEVMSVRYMFKYLKNQV